MKDENKCYKKGEERFKAGGSEGSCNPLDDIQDSQGNNYVNDDIDHF